MNLYSLYFSPTNNTKKVLNLISDELGGNHSDIDLSVSNIGYSNYSFSENDLCLIGMPVFGGRVSSVALERLRQMKSNGASAILVVAFGNRAYDDALLELKNEVKACGFFVIAAIAASAEHSIMHQYGTGRPDAKDEKELKGFALQIKDTLSCGKQLSEVFVPGNVPYKKYNGIPLKPKTGKACTECGICANSCPVGAIPKEDPVKTDHSLCISCMRCITICPNHARSVNSAMVFGVSQLLKKACSERKGNELYL